MGNLTNSAKLIEEMNKKAYTTDLGAAALSNQYDDLYGKPTIPTVNNSTIKIQKNSADVDSFTTNASNDKTINIQLTKSDVGLGNVDNTSDANKPVSNATQTALNAKANASDVYTKAEVDAKVGSVYKYKGSKSNYDALPSSGNVIGDVWNIETAHTTVPIFPAGSNLAWDGSAWDVLGGTVDLSNYLAKDNTTAFTPSGDYNPATKKYVDDNTKSVSGIGTTQPSNPVAGSTYYDTTNKVVKVYNGTSWEEVGGGNVIAMTQSEYEALPAATKNDGKLRIITDAPQIEIPVPDDTAFGSSWDGDTTHAPSKNAVYDAIGNIETLLAAL